MSSKLEITYLKKWLEILQILGVKNFEKLE